MIPPVGIAPNPRESIASRPRPGEYSRSRPLFCPELGSNGRADGRNKPNVAPPRVVAPDVQVSRSHGYHLRSSTRLAHHHITGGIRTRPSTPSSRLSRHNGISRVRCVSYSNVPIKMAALMPRRCRSATEYQFPEQQADAIVPTTAHHRRDFL